MIRLKMPDARRHFINQIVIMRHQQDRPLIPLLRNVQRVDRLQIQVIRRLIEH